MAAAKEIKNRITYKWNMTQKSLCDAYAKERKSLTHKHDALMLNAALLIISMIIKTTCMFGKG
jgi:hypothetical protein